MHRLSERVLAILLTLLLGLSPLQGAESGFALSANQDGSVHQMADGHDDCMDSDRTAAQDCGQCNSEAGCNGHSCSSGQCASCALAVHQVFSYHTNPTITSGFPRADDGIVKQLSSSLFRPPRV